MGVAGCGKSSIGAAIAAAAAVAWSKAMLSTLPQHPQDERRHPPGR
jgi:gluconate kinase